MAAKFPSQEWADAMQVKVNQSKDYAEAASKWEGDFYFEISDEGELIYMDLWHGSCREAIYTTDKSLKDPEFTISAKRAQWEKVLAGKLDPVQGMMTRQLKLEGNLMKVMQNVKAAQELVRCATQVETEF